MNGKAQAAVKIRRSDICIATISPGYADVREFPVKKPPEIRQLYYLKGEKPAVEFVEYIKGDPAAVSLNEAEIILAVGNGLGDPERLEIIRELAGLLGASLGATRVAVDHKWMPPERQIGITGLTVSPRLFISCGISGQYPHTVGMDSSETIIVINKDREAPMFKLATLGIVGTLEEIVPALSAHLKSLLESSKERIS
jgi:electron transfer flavoprotein alpha subunit